MQLWWPAHASNFTRLITCRRVGCTPLLKGVCPVWLRCSNMHPYGDINPEKVVRHTARMGDMKARVCQQPRDIWRMTWTSASHLACPHHHHGWRWIYTSRIFGATSCLGRALQAWTAAAPACRTLLGANPVPRKGCHRRGKTARCAMLIYFQPTRTGCRRPAWTIAIKQQQQQHCRKDPQAGHGRVALLQLGSLLRGMRLRTPQPPSCATWQLRVGWGQQRTCLGRACVR